MNENTLDNSAFEMNHEPDNKILMGALYAATLLYLYQNVLSLSYFLVYLIADNGYISYLLSHLTPIATVVLIGLLFKNQMQKKTQKRMVKIYITWLCSLFIYFILYNFHFRNVLFQLMVDAPMFLRNEDPIIKFLDTYISHLFYPLTMALVIYLLFLTTRTNKNNQL